MHVWTGPTSMRLDALLSSVVGVKVKEAQAMVASGELKPSPFAVEAAKQRPVREPHCH